MCQPFMCQPFMCQRAAEEVPAICQSGKGVASSPIRGMGVRLILGLASGLGLGFRVGGRVRVRSGLGLGLG